MFNCKLSYSLILGLLLSLTFTLFDSLNNMIATNRIGLAVVAHIQDHQIVPITYLSESTYNHYLQGTAFLLSGDVEQALSVLSVPDVQQRKPLSQWFLVRALVASNQNERAAALLNEMQLSSDQLVNLAQGKQSPDSNQLISLLAQQAIRQGGGSSATRRWLGLWSLANGNPGQAIEIIEPIITDADHHLWSQLGWAYYVLGDYAEAAQAFEHAFNQLPGHPLYQLRLAQAYQARNEPGDREEALHLLQELTNTDNNASAEVWFTLGWNHYVAGRGSEAVSAFSQALEKSPNNSYYQMRLAQSLVLRAQDGDRDHAIDLLKQAVAQSPDLAEAVELLQRLAQP